MKFSDDLLKTVSTILESKPRISFHETGADILDKAGNKIRTFSRKDLGEKYKKEAENFLSLNYKKLNAESVILDEKKKPKKDKGDMDGDGVDEPDSKEYMDNKDKAIKMAMKGKGKMDEAVDEGADDHVDPSKSSDCGSGEYFCKDEQKCKPIPEGMKLDGEQLVKEAVDASSSDPEKVIGHNCATHVEHKEHGAGECIPGMHTLEETEDGEGYVTHYDVMFTNENGPFIVEHVAVKDLEIIHESHHGHMKKKKKSMKSEEYSDDVKKKVNQGKMPHPEDPHGHLSGKQRKHQEKRDGLEAGYHKGYISDKDYDKGHKKLDKKYGTNHESYKPLDREHVDSISAALKKMYTPESNEMKDRMADEISGMPETSHKKKVAKKKAMKAFDKGDHEKAAEHAGIHLTHPD